MKDNNKNAPFYIPRIGEYAKAMHSDSRCLLNGKVYCASCGSRLIVATNGRYVYENGTRYKRLRYMCYGKSRKRTDCQGQTGYAIHILDKTVDGIIRHIFDNMLSISKSEVVTHSLEALRQEKDAIYRAAQKSLMKAGNDLAELKSEVLKAIRGESKFSPDILNELIVQAETELREYETTAVYAKRELDMCKYRIEDMQKRYDEVISWTELYDIADWSAKKMIVANLINRIEVGKDYQVHIDFNIDLENFGMQHEQFTANFTA